MQNQLSTVTRLFTGNLYRIPDYQRGYAWGDRQLKDFWSDVEQLDKDKSHYVGVLTLEKVPEAIHKTWVDDSWIIKSRKYQPYYVVDGQQRLTTIAILMHCIIDAIPKGKKIAYLTKEAIQTRFIFESKDDGISKSFLFGYEKDNPSYEYLITKIFNENSLNHSSNEETIYTKNLRNAKKFFNSKVVDFSLKKLEELFQKVSQQLLFNTYEIAEEVDVFVAFETMNNRGKALSKLELLKNRLIFLSTRMENDENTLASLRKAVNEAWKDVYHYLGCNEKRPLNDDTFLQRHLYLYHSKNILKIKDGDDTTQQTYLGRHFRDLERNGDDFLLDKLFNSKRLINKPDSFSDLPKLDASLINKYASDMKSNAQAYFFASSPSFSNVIFDDEKIWLERINRLQGYEPSVVVLFVAQSEKNKDKRVQFWEILERYAFVRSIGLNSPHHQILRAESDSELLKLINGKRTLNEFSEYLTNSTALLAGKDFSESLLEWTKSGTTYYGWSRVKYFLFEYEIYLQSQTKSNKSKLDWDAFAIEKFESDYETVEHVYPKRALHDYWKSRFSKYSPKEKALLRNSLGNLLALSRPKNSSLSNKPFPEKVGEGESKIGYTYGGYSEIDVAKYSEWDADAITSRGIRMLKFLEDRWKLQIGDNHQKLKALGLDFVISKSILSLK